MPTAMIIYTMIFLLGLLIGGFVNLCTDRFIKNESFRKKAYCDTCGIDLQWHDMIPIISFLLLKGRCRSCGAKVKWQYPAAELTNGVLYVIVFMANGFNIQSLLFCLLTSAFLVISIVDGNTLEIPEPCVIFIGVIGVILTIMDFRNLPSHLIGFLAVSAALYLIWWVTGGAAMGGGDVKLMAAAGLALGWKTVIVAFFLGCIIGSVIHLIRMKVSKANRVLAMGPYLCLGLWLGMFLGEKIFNWYFSFLIP